MQSGHDPVAGDLGEHARGGDAGGHPVPLPHRQPRRRRARRPGTRRSARTPAARRAAPRPGAVPRRWRRACRAGRTRRTACTTTDQASARRRIWRVAALARLLGQQLGVGQARARCRPGPAAGSRRRRPAGRRRRRGRPRRRRRSARCRPGAGRARSRRARRHAGRSDRGAAGTRRHGSGGVGHVRERVGAIEPVEAGRRARAARRPCRRPGRPGRTRRPGRSRSASGRHMWPDESAECAAVVAHHEDRALGHRPGLPVAVGGASGRCTAGPARGCRGPRRAARR